MEFIKLDTTKGLTSSANAIRFFTDYDGGTILPREWQKHNGGHGLPYSLRLAEIRYLSTGMFESVLLAEYKGRYGLAIRIMCDSEEDARNIGTYFETLDIPHRTNNAVLVAEANGAYQVILFFVLNNSWVTTNTAYLLYLLSSRGGIDDNEEDPVSDFAHTMRRDQFSSKVLFNEETMKNFNESFARRNRPAIVSTIASDERRIVRFHETGCGEDGGVIDVILAPQRGDDIYNAIRALNEAVKEAKEAAKRDEYATMDLDDIVLLACSEAAWGRFEFTQPPECCIEV